MIGVLIHFLHSLTVLHNFRSLSSEMSFFLLLLNPFLAEVFHKGCLILLCNSNKIKFETIHSDMSFTRFC